MKQVKEGQIYMISLICGIFKNGTNELIYKTEVELQMKKIILWLLGEREAGVNWIYIRFSGIDIYPLLYIKIDDNDQLDSTSNSPQYPVMNYMVKKFLKEWIS